MKKPITFKATHEGFALIEVLVSLVIFSLGVIGLVGMQTRALQASTDAQDRNIAALLANSVSSEMWALKSTSLSSDSIATWKTQVAADLPNGKGEITQNTSGTDATVSIKWLSPTRQAKSSANPEAGGEDPSQFVTRVVIPK